MTREEAERILQGSCAQLAEHFDAIQILASRVREEGDTLRVWWGSGNWYARQGMAQEFIHTEQAREIAQAIRPAEEEP